MSDDSAAQDLQAQLERAAEEQRRATEELARTIAEAAARDGGA
ncbi:hypothetical protein AB0L71_28060 [Streptomyces sp. NPDC052052]